MICDVAECGEYDGGAADGGEWGIWGAERGLERVSAAIAVMTFKGWRRGDRIGSIG